eukprot:203224-Rhodomonas_salina.1
MICRRVPCSAVRMARCLASSDQRFKLGIPTLYNCKNRKRVEIPLSLKPDAQHAPTHTVPVTSTSIF